MKGGRTIIVVFGRWRAEATFDAKSVQNERRFVPGARGGGIGRVNRRMAKHSQSHRVKVAGEGMAKDGPKWTTGFKL